MKKTVTSLFFLRILSLLAIILCGVSVFAKEDSNTAATEEGGAFISADLLLPQSAASFISIRDIHALDDSWAKTAMGKMMARDDMTEFTKLFRKQFSEIFSTLESRLGVSMEEIIQMTDSEIAISTQKIKDESYGLVLVVNVGDKIFETKKVLSKLADRVLKDGGNYQKQEALNSEIHILTMKNEETGELCKAYYVLWGEILFSSNQQILVKDILGRIAKLQKDPDAYVEALGEKDSYIEILNQTVGTDKKLPDIIWYVDPITTMEIQRMIAVENNPELEDERDVAAVLSNAGFGGIKAVGGVITFVNQGYDMTHRVFAYIPEEPQKGLKMVAFDQNADKDLPDWITEDVGSVQIVNLDLLKIFDNAGPLVDSLFGEDRESVWEDVLDGLKNDTKGPMIDLREEIVALLGNKVIFTVANVNPKALDGERYMVAVQTKDEKKLRANIARFLGGEENFEVVSEGDDIRWIRVEDASGDDEFTEEEKAGKRFRQPAVTIWDGYLIVASQPDYIDELKSAVENGKKPLAGNAVYKAVLDEVQKKTKKVNPISFHFDNNAVERQHSYEMAKQGKWTESSAMYSSLLDQFFRANQGLKEDLDKFDNSSLPDYEEVKDYFLPSGAYLYEVEKGLIFQGFWMSEKKMGIELK
ncbi:MAG: hypothetical protein IJQ31_15430 [Thermoguttaceae bacterium]|nr:hypothetical protein [Thermoguttaceae bacterium]